MTYGYLYLLDPGHAAPAAALDQLREVITRWATGEFLFPAPATGSAAEDLPWSRRAADTDREVIIVAFAFPDDRPSTP